MKTKLYVLTYRTTVSLAADNSPSVRYALDAIGRHPVYRFGATGPDAYDCSGLTMAALSTLGCELPHNSSEQVRWFQDNAILLDGDTPEHRHALVPGRSVAFYYGDVTEPDSVGHCALYIGRSPALRFYMVAAAVDVQYGVIRHRMSRFLRPCGYGILKP